MLPREIMARILRPDIVANIFTAPDDEIADMATRYGCRTKTVAAGAVILRQGAVADRLYDLRKGLLCATIRTKGKHLTLDIFVEGNLFTATESMVFGSPSAYAIEALDPSEYVEIPRETFERMLDEQPRLHHQVAVHHRLWNARMTRRLIELMTTSPLERYRSFVREHPDLLNRLPQYRIASMLGISPESLSRLRKRIAAGSKR
jgi:CRP-like cAMP-binding protein